MHELLTYVQTRSPTDLGRDLLDLLITFVIFYRIALVIRGTRAMQVGAGIALVFILYLVAEVLRLRTLLTLLSAVLSSSILIGVVVFQNDIRRGLMRVGARARFGVAQSPEQEVIDHVVDAATTLARHRTGALITFEQDANLDEFVGSHTGQTIDAAVTTELLVSLFIPEAMNKLHDGAVIIRDLRIAKAGVFFPMPEGKMADESFGSRHRAAMGITEETDAIVIVVSEERGSISFCFNGNIISNLDGPKLRAALEGIFQPRRPAGKHSLWSRLFGGDKASSSPTEEEAPPQTQRSPKRDSVPAPPSVETQPEQLTPVPLRKQDKTQEEAPKPLRKSVADVKAESDAEAPPTPLRKTTETLTRDSRPTETPAPAAQPAPEPLRKRKDKTATADKVTSETSPSSTRVLPKPGEVLTTPLRHMAPAKRSDSEPPPATDRRPEAVPMPRAEPPEGSKKADKDTDDESQEPASGKAEKAGAAAQPNESGDTAASSSEAAASEEHATQSETAPPSSEPRSSGTDLVASPEGSSPQHS